MNIQLHHVISTVTGITGMKIIRAIVAGERGPGKLAAMRGVRCQGSIETIRSALVGNYQPEHVFALKQALALYDFYQQCIDECDAEIERAVAALNLDRPMPGTQLPKMRHRTRQPSDPNFDVRSAMHQLAGADLTQIHGIAPYLVLRLIAECGTDLSRWRTAKHFTSWLTLSPGCKISDGKVLSARIGKTKAVTATARKIVVLFYNAMRYGMDYRDPGADHYEQQYRDRVIKQRHRRAAQFGFTLHPQDSPESGCVS